MGANVPPEIAQYVDNAVWEMSEKRDLRPGAVAYSVNRIFGINYTIDDVMESLRAMKRERRRDRDSRSTAHNIDTSNY